MNVDDSSHLIKFEWGVGGERLRASAECWSDCRHRHGNECEDGGAKWIYLIIIAKKGLTSRIRVYK